ncbi:unnamed protein product [Didymodactylos carnosus]|uniref:Cytochrome b-c1 complex subunit Rieske, mitochondrial n=1 Tax=Didymodactylos carnosus TaxID=1234261 RepID=A0A813XUA8_9BILA|nr:unnamed protein product [Didymodactylos carnosus]CAF1458035.1 unnamed protein product [Didymodactylos carnosus]CAF3660354.1 unnamed protein product [Didymodactylos carnosus]CAF4251843.1 unnamed protein product [Didymodactylos carnosus]
MALQLRNRIVTQVTTNLLRSMAKPIPMHIDDDPEHEADQPLYIQVPKCRQPLTTVSMQKKLLRSNVSISTGLSSPISVRHAHTDIQIPNFDYYRRKDRRDPNKSYRDSGDATSPFSYLAPMGIAITSAMVAKYSIRTIVDYVGPAKDILAVAKIEIPLDGVPEGKNVVFEWRGKPVFVRHRTPEEIMREQGVDVSQLRDQQADADRVKKPEWLIVIGICTHLGCIPVANAGDFGGYYCPCHGSHYDASGRVRKGPAPLNLEVPEYKFKDDNTIVIG